MVEVELSLPLHAEQMVVCWVYRTQAKGTPDVYFGHQSPTIQVHDGIDSNANRGVAKWEVRIPNAVIDTVPWGVGKVHDEAPFP